MTDSKMTAITQPVSGWQRLGQVLERGGPGEHDSGVLGDACVVWDPDRACYHMFYFAQQHADGHDVNHNAHAVSIGGIGPGVWRKQGALVYANPEALSGETHKPWILMDPYHPNQAVRVDGEYWLFTVSFRGNNKVIQVAIAASLDGPWRVRPEPVVNPGAEQAFDGYHVDAVSAYWFEARAEIAIFYMGYPRCPQRDQVHTPYGSSNAVALLRRAERTARKVGKTVGPSPDPRHWTAGWVGGLQIFPAARGGWYGLLNASPTQPAAMDDEPNLREPAPSLGGWAYTPERYPFSGWQALAGPIERIEDIPAQAALAGERVNQWRHHIVILPDRSMVLLYNSGSYGDERLFGRHLGSDLSTATEIDRADVQYPERNGGGGADGRRRPQ